MTRYTIALLTLIFLLIAGISTLCAEESYTTIAIPQQSGLSASLNVLDSTPGQTSIQWSASELIIVRDGNGDLKYQVPGPRSIETEDIFPVHGGYVALPWGFEGNLRIKSADFYRLNSLDDLVADATMRTAGVYADDFVQLGEAVIFRDMVIAPLTIQPVVEGVDGSIWVAANLDLEVKVGEPMEEQSRLEHQRPISRAFLPLYEAILLNEIDDMGLEVADTKGSYLIVSSTTYEAQLITSGFVDWKRQTGFNVVIETFDPNDGLSLQDLTDIVSDAYDTLDPPLEYVLLMGDQNRGEDSIIPANYIAHPEEPTENDVTDWPITFLDGQDYFPEVMIGRFSIGDTQEAVKVTRRSVRYEKNHENISLTDPYWNSAAIVAGNYNEGGGNPLTPVAISQWLADQMRQNWGFGQVYELYWRHGGNNANAQDITAAIEEGVSWVTYRGWGNASGWVKPEFGISDVEDLTNYNRLPVVTSFVCNTGDFGNGLNGGKCFGEAWVTAGSVNEPIGAVAVIAPSDLHTFTRYNNSLIAGFYHGVYEDNLHTISSALLRAKTELYLGFPLERGQNDFVEFYYHVYHVLGDPALSFWRGVPKEFDISMPSEVPLGQGHVDITVQGQSGPHKHAYVQLIQGENLFVGSYTNESGVASLDIIHAVEGDIEVTITAPNYLPIEDIITVEQQQNSVGVMDWSVDAGADGLVSRGEQIDLEVTLVNGGTAVASNVSAILTFADSDLVTIIDDEADFGTIQPGADSDNSGDPFTFRLEENISDELLLEFELEITSGQNTWTGKIWTLTGREKLRFVEYENVGGYDFAPGETTSLRFMFQNQGSVDATDLDAILSTYDESITSISGSVNNLDFMMGDEVWVGNFEIMVDSDTWRGRPIPFMMHFEDDGETYGTVMFTVSLEGAQSSDPFGPDAYGYYAYDNTDVAWPDNAPTYQWFDLDEDPQVDEHMLLADDQNAHLTLPFDIKYYGETYAAGSPLTISSNGWISLADEGDYTVNFFRNWQIPSVIGPQVMIAPFWDDIGPQIGADHMNVYYKVDSDNDRLIIEWSDALNRWNNTDPYPAYFALVVYEEGAIPTTTGDSVIEMYYQEVVNIDDKNNFATVGIEKPDRTTGLEYTYSALYADANAELDDGLAIRFTTNTPDDLNPIEELKDGSTLPGEFVLYPVQPNPFNSSTVISFDIPEGGDVKLSIYNLLGQEIASLVDRPMTAGHKEVVWQIEDHSISSGMLLIRLSVNDQELWGKMMYVK